MANRHDRVWTLRRWEGQAHRPNAAAEGAGKEAYSSPRQRYVSEATEIVERSLTMGCSFRRLRPRFHGQAPDALASDYGLDAEMHEVAFEVK